MAELISSFFFFRCYLYYISLFNRSRAQTVKKKRKELTSSRAVNCLLCTHTQACARSESDLQRRCCMTLSTLFPRANSHTTLFSCCPTLVGRNNNNKKRNVHNCFLAVYHVLPPSKKEKKKRDSRVFFSFTTVLLSSPLNISPLYSVFLLHGFHQASNKHTHTKKKKNLAFLFKKVFTDGLLC